MESDERLSAVAGERMSIRRPCRKLRGSLSHSELLRARMESDEWLSAVAGESDERLSAVAEESDERIADVARKKALKSAHMILDIAFM
jgi:hypothetical protein